MAQVKLVEYSEDWPGQFGRAAAELAERFRVDDARIEHIGSTSVPGLCAKPVIDVLVGVRDLDRVREHVSALADLGYRYRPETEAEIPERRYFVRDADERLRVHVHGVTLGGRLWREHLAFRDALRTQPGLAADYARLKRELAATHANDKAAYTAAKAPFITRTLADLLV